MEQPTPQQLSSVAALLVASVPNKPATDLPQALPGEPGLSITIALGFGPGAGFALPIDRIDLTRDELRAFGAAVGDNGHVLIRDAREVEMLQTAARRALLARLEAR